MQWKTITTGLGKTAYSLWGNGRKLVTLAYKNQAEKVYVELEDGEKRYFSYRKKGLINPSVVLENEYGTSLSALKKEAGKESIEIDSTCYYLHFIDEKNVEIKKEDDDTLVAVCNLDEVKNTTEKENSGLLMVLCYYLFGHPQSNKELRPFL